MRVGIVPNIYKDNILDVVGTLIQELKSFEIDYIISSSLKYYQKRFTKLIYNSTFMENVELCKNSDVVISIGGDGTMLNTAFEAREHNTPLLGLNFGKLGFLAEFDMNSISSVIKDLKHGNYEVEERITLDAYCNGNKDEKLFAINDIVIDKGGWPKMIQLAIDVDDKYVSTFSADGIIIATPTGSTGYSLSTGGPIVSPKADVMTLNPISPHTLTMRPLVLSSKNKILIEVNSQHTSVQINCDGQRVHYFKPPVKIEIEKSKHPVRLVHTNMTNYFEILRKKLYWGIDVRSNSNSDKF